MPGAIAPAQTIYEGKMCKVNLTVYAYRIFAGGDVERDVEPTLMTFEARDKNHALFLAWNAAYYFPGVASATMESGGKIEWLGTPPAGKAMPVGGTPGLYVHDGR